MQKIFTILIALTFFHSNANAMDHQEDNSNNSSPHCAVELIPSVPDNLNNRIEQIKIKNVNKVNPLGVFITDETVHETIKKLSDSEKREVILHALNGNFEAGRGTLGFWKFIKTVCHPIWGLALVANAVLPVLQNTFGEKYSSAINISIVACSVIALSFGKFSAYAEDAIDHAGKILLILKTIKESKKTTISDGRLEDNADNNINNNIDDSLNEDDSENHV